MISAEDIKCAFAACGVSRGDVLMLHADALVLAQLPPMAAEARYAVLFDALNDLLEPEGTLVLPTFTYSFTRGEVFEPARSPSTVGALSEYFRTLPGVVRSGDPIFSLAARGRLAEAIAQADPADCFGPASAFALLAAQGAWLACLGCSLDRITFTHFVEQTEKVDYRYFKDFSGPVVEGETSRMATVRYFVRDPDRPTTLNLRRLEARLIESGRLHKAPIGRVGLSLVRAHAFHQTARELLAEDPCALIEEGRGG
jgi:aminoglycoside 3-N-acetyltransferase